MIPIPQNNTAMAGRGGAGGGANGAAEAERAPLQAWGGDVKGMIAEVKAVCPGLGDGFVHACLAVFRYNVAMVVNALLEGGWGGALPYPLDTLDRALPSPMQAKRPEGGGGGGLEEERDEEFLAVQKAYVRQMEREEVRCVVVVGWLVWWSWWWWVSG